MKFIRNWLKKLIAEAILENFPKMEITVVNTKDSKNILYIKNGIFIESNITTTECDDINLYGCYIKKDYDKPFIEEEKQ